MPAPRAGGRGTKPGQTAQAGAAPVPEITRGPGLPGGGRDGLAGGGAGMRDRRHRSTRTGTPSNPDKRCPRPPSSRQTPRPRPREKSQNPAAHPVYSGTGATFGQVAAGRRRAPARTDRRNRRPAAARHELPSGQSSPPGTQALAELRRRRCTHPGGRARRPARRTAARDTANRSGRRRPAPARDTTPWSVSSQPSSDARAQNRPGPQRGSHGSPAFGRGAQRNAGGAAQGRAPSGNMHRRRRPRRAAQSAPSASRAVHRRPQPGSAARAGGRRPPAQASWPPSRQSWSMAQAAPSATCGSSTAAQAGSSRLGVAEAGEQVRAGQAASAARQSCAGPAAKCSRPWLNDSSRAAAPSSLRAPSAAIHAGNLKHLLAALRFEQRRCRQ